MLTEQLIRALSKELSVAQAGPTRIGIDLVHIARIEESLRTIGERFVHRMFTAQEADYANSAPHARAERLAARFAAKEAAIKALGLPEAGIDWREIEVVREDDGRCSLALHGRALQHVRAIGSPRALVCLSHDGEYAAAVVAVLSDNTGIHP